MAQCVELTEESDARARASAVLQDVIRTMYNPKFIAELFRGQDVYSMHSTRQIFDKLAHSSIMRLNESSMDKASATARPPNDPSPAPPPEARL